MRARRILRFTFLGAAALVLAVACALAFPSGRAAIFRTAFASYLWTKGFHLDRIDVSIGHGVFDARDIRISQLGQPFFSSDEIRVTYGAADRALGIASVEVVRPRLIAQRMSDGSFDVSRLFGSGQSGGASQPIRAAVRIQDGSVDILNAYSPARPGRALALRHIELDAKVAQGSFSSARASLLVESAGKTSRASARYWENDVSKIAAARFDAPHTALAPVADLILSSSAFVVENGSADVALRAYAAGWAEKSGPQWHVIGGGSVLEGRVRTLPLSVPIRDIAGRFSVFDGTLEFFGLTARTAGVPMRAAGMVRLLPTAQLGLNVSASGDLSRVRSWLPFSSKLPLSGPVALAATIDGNPSSPHADVELHGRGPLRYARVPIRAFRTRAYYHDGHVALRDTAAIYAKASVYGQGDIDLTATPAAGQFIVSMRAPSATLPWVADFDSKGMTSARAALSGPLMRLGGSGFAATRGGEQRIRAEIAAGPDRLAVESIVQDLSGGELVASTSVDRTGDREIAGDAFANDFSTSTNGAAVALPGITATAAGIPRATAIVNGYASIRGTLDAPYGVVRLSARQVAYAGHDIGKVVVGVAGDGRDFQVQRLALSGPEARLEAAGNGRLISAPGGRSSIVGAIEGNAHANLSMLGVAGGLRGATDGTFDLAFDGESWLAAAKISGSHASVSGIPIQGLRAVVGRQGTTTTVYAASADVAGGRIDAQGSIPGSSRGSLAVTARGVDLATVRGPGFVLSRGVVVGIARVGGTAGAPSLSGAAALNGGLYAGASISGDVQAAYRRGTLTLRDGRVVAGNTVASLDGTIGALNSGDPSLALDVTIPEGDLAGLSAAFAPSSVPLTGIASARLRASGSLARPAIAGDLMSDVGTVRGVEFDDLHATFAAAPGAIDVRSGDVRFGSSRITMAGNIASNAVRLRAASPRIDLNDFNDFFDGKDVLEGHGALDVVLDSSHNRSDASGFIHLDDSRISGIPLGSLDARFRPEGAGATVAIRQRGALARSDVSISMTRDSGGHQLALANGSVRSLDLGMLASYVGAEDQDISGTGLADVRAAGRPGAYRADVAFRVDRGRIRRTDIREAAGDVSFNPQSIDVRALRLAIDGATLSASGILDRSGRVEGTAVADVNDLHALERFSQRPISMNGKVSAHVDASGTVAQPIVRARVSAGMGQIHHVAYDSISIDAAYDRGRVVASGGVQLADGHGALRASARVPLRLRPLGIGPNDGTVRLYGSAASVGIGALAPLMGAAVAADGLLDGRLFVAGTVGRPEVSGDVRVRGATVRSQFDAIPLTGLDADVAFARDTIDLRRAHASVGPGTLDAHGSVHIVPATALRPEPGLQYRLGAALHNAGVDVPNLMRGTVDARVGMTKSAAVPYLFGDVQFSDTSIPFASILALASSQNSGPAPGSAIPGLPPVRRDHIVVYGGSIFGGSDRDHVLRSDRAPMPQPAMPPIIPSRVGLGMKVTAAKNVRVTGLLNVAGSGSVDISGDTAAPRLNGTLTALRGRAGLLNTSFDLLDGWLTFKPKQGLLPTVSADAITHTDDADITISTYGRVDQLHTDMQSDPPMDRDAIVATLLRVPQLNSALASSQGQAQSAFGVSPRDLVSGVVAGQVLGALNIGLEQVFNLEEVDFGIDPLGRPTLELRKQISPRAYTLYRTTFTVTPAEALGIAYQVRRALRIELSQSQATPGILTSYAYPQTSIVVRMMFH